MIKRLSSRVGRKTLLKIAHGLVISKLNYGLELFATVFEEEKYKESNSRHSAFTRGDSMMLQKTLNSLARVVTGKGKRTSTKELMSGLGILPLNQQAAYVRIMFVLKVQSTQKPKSLASCLEFEEGEGRTRSQRQVKTPRYKTRIAMDSLLFQGSQLANRWAKDQDRVLTKEETKSEVKVWVKANIPEKVTRNRRIPRELKRRTDDENPPKRRRITDYYDNKEKMNEGEKVKATTNRQTQADAETPSPERSSYGAGDKIDADKGEERPTSKDTVKCRDKISKLKDKVIKESKKVITKKPDMLKEWLNGGRQDSIRGLQHGERSQETRRDITRKEMRGENMKAANKRDSVPERSPMGDSDNETAPERFPKGNSDKGKPVSERSPKGDSDNGTGAEANENSVKEKPVPERSPKEDSDNGTGDETVKHISERSPKGDSDNEMKFTRDDETGAGKMQIAGERGGARRGRERRGRGRGRRGRTR